MKLKDISRRINHKKTAGTGHFLLLWIAKRLIMPDRWRRNTSMTTELYGYGDRILHVAIDAYRDAVVLNNPSQLEFEGEMNCFDDAPFCESIGSNITYQRPRYGETIAALERMQGTIERLGVSVPIVTSSPLPAPLPAPLDCDSVQSTTTSQQAPF
jgi:hypothetical protein